LSPLTNAVAVACCDDKRITARLLARAGIAVPRQVEATGTGADAAFLRAHGALVVKPARGEQGRGVSVGVRDQESLARAVERARAVAEVVLLEELVPGSDLRVIVIDDEVVAAAVRRPPEVVGNGRDSIERLIADQSRRRQAETRGHSKIPCDDETRRVVREAGYELSEILPEAKRLTVRRAANLHTGGTLHDVTHELHPHLAEVSRRAARALDIPVVGLDLMVPDPKGAAYSVIEANERPGLANHEPQPTASRFVDFLFPETSRRAR
jgi:GNAT-family acetyltransferase (TIGR03103 family)